MATYTPPPYFPQGSLAPPDARRYRRFKLILFAVAALLLLALGAAAWGVVALLRWLL